MRRVSRKFLVAAAGLAVSTASAAMAQTTSGPFDLSSGLGSPYQYTPSFALTGVDLDPIYASATTNGGLRYRRLSGNSATQDVVVGALASAASPNGGDPISAGSSNDATSSLPVSIYNVNGTSDITFNYTAPGSTVPGYLSSYAGYSGPTTSANGTISQQITGGTDSPAISYQILPAPYVVTLAGANGLLNWLHIALQDSDNGANGSPSTVSFSGSITDPNDGTYTLPTFSASNDQNGTNEFGTTAYNPAYEITGLDLNNGFEVDGTLGESNMPAAAGSENEKLEIDFGSVPEPGTLSLLGLGAMGLFARRRRVTA